jgi:hypothetical protein
MPGSLAAAVLAGLGLTPAVSAVAAQPQFLSWPATTPTLTEGTVLSTSGSWDQSESPHARVVVMAAPETTLRTVATAVQGWLAAIASPHQAVPDVVGTGRALLAYHTDDLDLAAVLGAGVAVSPSRFPAWQVGTAVPLPIEFDPSVASPSFVTDLQLWGTLAGSMGPGADTLLDYLPGRLPLPDHDADDAWASSQITAAAALTDLCAPTRTGLLTNPSAALYRGLALLRHVDGQPDADRTAFLTTLVSGTLNAAELAMLATMAPGAVVLRALYRRLAALPAPDPATTAAAAAVLTALGFASGAASVDFWSTAPPVAARELPASVTWRVRPELAAPHYDSNGERADGRHDVVLGRAIHCGGVHTETYAGIAYRGPAFAGQKTTAASDFLAGHAGELNPAGDARLADRLAAVTVIAPNEGHLDAVRQRDRAILAVGIQQWSADSDVELTLLLWQFRQQYPDDYDAHLGLYGLGLSLTSSYPDGSPQAVAMSAVTSTGSTPMPGASAAQPGIPPGRLAYFGGFRVDATHCQFLDPADDTRLSPWPARIRNAVLCSRGLQRLQLLEAARRFTKIAGENRTYAVGSGGTTCTIGQLVTSVQAAAQLLDQHVNNPKLTVQSIKAAIHATPGDPGLDAFGDPSPAWLTAFEAAYLTAVAYPAGVPKHDVHDAVTNKLISRGRQDRILAAGLSTAVRSFHGW